MKKVQVRKETSLDKSRGLETISLDFELYIANRFRM